MSAAPPAVTPDHPPIQCLLELRYDGTVAIIAKHGCTNEDIRDLLRQLAHGITATDTTAPAETPRSTEMEA